ncbi:MAG: arginyltransferase [Betaproteobacteria bacterium]|nr:arginyltransferase [Betaproteobacteria bacterium]
MTSLYDLPAQPLQCYLTTTYPCSYLTGETTRSQVISPGPQITPNIFSALIEQGFRRSGLFTYRPYCTSCRACFSVRIPVAHFSANRSQRRTWHLHQELSVQDQPLLFQEEHYRLYQNYQRVRHPSPQEHDSPEQYRQFLLQSPVSTRLVEFHHHQQLVMVSLIDPLLNGLSSVYTFYDPEWKGPALGTFNILWQIEECRRLGHTWLYLGYWIKDSPKMCYKSRFQPLEIWFNGAWHPFSAFPFS